MIANTLSDLGWLLRNQERYQHAKVCLEEAVTLHAKAEEKRNTANSMCNLGVVEVAPGNYDRARALLQQSLALYTELNYRGGLAYVFEAFMALAAVQATPLLATQLGGAAEELRERLASPLPPAEHALHQRLLDTSRAHLDQAAWGHAWQRGRTLDLEEAMALARSI